MRVREDIARFDWWPMNRSHFSQTTEHWGTPKAVYEGLNSEFNFDFDPCPMNSATDGLSPMTIWSGRRVYCNPPYGHGLAKWLERGLEASLAVFLLPARTDTKWFHDIVLPKAKEIRFVRGRIKFREKDPTWKPGSGTAPFPSMIVVFGKDELSEHDSTCGCAKEK